MKEENININKYIKGSVVFGILIISISIAYYFLFFLPQKELQDQKVRCRDAALGYHEQFKQEYPKEHQYDLDGPASIHTPKYHFSKKLNTCLYSGGISEFAGRFNVFIIDVYSNKKILEYFKDGSGHVYTSADYQVENFDKFEAMEKQLFGE